MSTYRIRLNVEFQRGQVVGLEWENDCIQWSRLDKRVLRATVVRVRKDHFSFDAKVRDVTAGLFDPKSGQLCKVANPKRIHAKSLVFVLESPHRDEYHEINGKWTAQEPLSGSRGVFEKHLASVLKGLKLRDPIRVVLCNPVQWQTSLHRFYLTNTKTRRKWPLQGSVRKQIWCQLWNYSLEGEAPVQANFVSRLLAYNPKFIINACSMEFRIPVGLLLGQYFNLKTQPYTVNHPSGWKWAANRVLVKRWYLPTDKNACELE